MAINPVNLFTELSELQICSSYDFKELVTILMLRVQGNMKTMNNSPPPPRRYLVLQQQAQNFMIKKR